MSARIFGNWVVIGFIAGGAWRFLTIKTKHGGFFTVARRTHQWWLHHKWICNGFCKEKENNESLTDLDCTQNTWELHRLPFLGNFILSVNGQSNFGPINKLPYPVWFFQWQVISDLLTCCTCDLRTRWLGASVFRFPAIVFLWARALHTNAMATFQYERYGGRSSTRKFEH